MGIRTRLAWVVGGLLLATLAPGATAKGPDESVRWRHTYSEALLEARLRNVPVLVSRHKDG